MQVSPINQNMNNNRTSFKKLEIIERNKMPAKLLSEISTNPEIISLVKFLHEYKANLCISRQRIEKESRGWLYMNVVNAENKVKTVFHKMYPNSQDTTSFLNFFEEFNAKEVIDSLDSSIIPDLAPNIIKEKALKAIDELNNSLK